MNFNLSSPASQDLPLHYALGRELLYQKLKEVPIAVLQAFEDFQTALRQAQDKLWKLQQLGDYECADVSLYDLEKHKFTLMSPAFVTVFSTYYKSTEKQSKTYLNDFLTHRLIPKLASRVIGEESSEEVQNLQTFLHYKLNKENPLREPQKGYDHLNENCSRLVNKVQERSMRSSSERQEHKAFKKSLEGQLAIKKNELARLKERNANLTESFNGIDLDLIQLKLLDEKKTPAFTLSTRESKENLNELLVFLRKESMPFEELKEIVNRGVANRRCLEKVLNAWNNLEENQEDFWSWKNPKSVFQAFKDALCMLLKDIELYCVEVEELENSIDCLTRQIEEKHLQSHLEVNGETEAKDEEDEDSGIGFVMDNGLFEGLSIFQQNSEQVSEIEDGKTDGGESPTLVTPYADFFEELPALRVEEPVSLMSLEEEKSEACANREEQSMNGTNYERIREAGQAETSVHVLAQFPDFDLTALASETPWIDPLYTLDRVDDALMPTNEVAALAKSSDSEDGVSASASIGRGVELNAEAIPTLKFRLINAFNRFKSYAQKTAFEFWNRMTAFWRHLSR
ncbi:hypothetical protein [Candidatus Protochlamydia naegleriophila]|nr:hypothetical protein [Candidatus Protochlamydia naegleriophila]